MLQISKKQGYKVGMINITVQYTIYIIYYIR